nr:immunoglobulin light chain junction region [Macaca mulatta]MOW42251.1 immunoglobulin light chain junction region [Macaca mulatta]MOW61663.1 immunoglobulin light chain junction region [Macaca mulatta]MOW62093.1 immunoglobulin light chain junction region [Macaca mulatta]MOW62184.1 immunoglobulin light chain junction region [Macaca mulatta]
CMQSLDFPWTF